MSGAASPPADAASAGQTQTPVFVTGSTMRHVVVMTATGSVGLMAIFLVDFLSLLYVSWLGRPAATAGVGFATTVLFLATSANIGFLIAVSALASRRIGQRDREGARRIAGSTIALMVLTSALIAVAMLAIAPWLLRRLGAQGEAYTVALSFLWIAMPSNVLMALGMGYSGALRAVGDARRSMYVTLSGGIVIAFLDPLLIFVAGLGTDGAAWATVVSRACFALVGWWGAVKIHDTVAFPTLAGIRADLRAALDVAGPAVLTNLATPVAGAIVASMMSGFGDKAVAALAIIDRVTPVAFGVLFALSGAVGPILGQNWGARRFDRMRQVLIDATILCAGYVLLVWAVLVLSRYQLVNLFHVTGLTAELILLFALISGPMWLTLGGLFVANAAFNNLGFPLYSTAFNWGRVAALPLVWLGGHLGGPPGILIGVAAGGALFGISALILSFRVVRRLEQQTPESPR